MGRISVQGYEPAHLSYSTINGYRECGKRFFLQKIVRVEQLPGLAAIGGNAVHSATELLDRAAFAGTDVDTLRTSDG